MPVSPITQITTTIPQGKIKCYVTGGLRKDTPEEHVRQRVARSLVEEYGYRKADLALEVSVQLGSDKKRADIVIYEEEQTHILENIRIVVEAKRDTVKPSHTDQGIAQLKSYMSAIPNAEYGMWVGSEMRCFQKVEAKKKFAFADILDIPFAIAKGPAGKTFASLVPATDVLKDVFKRCHNYISANQGGSKEFAFHEFLKVTFCKVFDERFSSNPRFYIEPTEQKSVKGQKVVLERISELFKDVCEHYGYIFGEDDRIGLKPPIVAYIVNELQKYSLLETDFDYKGQAYEEIVGANSRGERGEFFTPRNLCSLAISIVTEIVGKNKIVTKKILDPAVGTGGFLRTYIHSIHETLLAREIEKWGDTDTARTRANDALKAICDKNVYGIDFNPVLVRAAQMNLVMHGDGSSNVFHENSLLAWGEWSDQTREKIKDGSFDIIVTNPPFGEDLLVDDPHILDLYTLSTFGIRGRRAEMAPQELFVERCHRLLRAGGILAIVTPDSLLSNPNYKYIRLWIVLHFTILSSISLPGEMFQPSTGTQTSLLVLKKRPAPLKDLTNLGPLVQQEPIFMSVPRRIGHDQRGAFIPLRDDGGDVVVRQVTKRRYVRGSDGQWHQESFEETVPVANDELPKVYSDFHAWFAAQDA